MTFLADSVMEAAAALPPPPPFWTPKVCQGHRSPPSRRAPLVSSANRQPTTPTTASERAAAGLRYGMD